MINIFKKIALTFLLLSSVFLPRVVLADSCSDLQSKFPTNSNLAANVAGLPHYCDVESVYSKIISTTLYAIGIVATIMIIYGGYIYMTARGNADQSKRGRSILIWSIIGLIVVLAASAIVNAVVRFVVEN